MNLFKRLRAYIRLYRATRMADEAYSRTHQRQYVICDHEGHLLVIDRYNLRRLKRKQVLPPSITVKNLEISSIYHTPHGNGTGAMPPELQTHRRKQYINRQ